jgi:hypothetical protein
MIEEHERQQMIDKVNKLEQRANKINDSAIKIQGAIKGHKARETVRQQQAKQLSSQIEPQSNLAMRPKEVRPKPTSYIHIDTQTPAQREASIRALLR